MRFCSLFLFFLFVCHGYAQDKPFWTVEVGSFVSSEKLPDDFSKKLLKLDDIKIVSSEADGKIIYSTEKVYSNKEAQELSRKLREHGFKTRVNHPNVLQKEESLVEGSKEKKWKTGERVEFAEVKSSDCKSFIVCVGKYAYDTPKYVKDAISNYKEHELIIRGAETNMVVTKYAYDHTTALRVKKELLSDGFLGTKLICNDGQEMHPELKKTVDKKKLTQKLENKESTNKNGPWITKYKSGEVFEEGTLKNGKLDGPFTAYHENGEVMAKGNYDEGVKEGLWVWYHPNGNKKKEGSFRDGYRVGTWTSYNKEGEVSGTVNAD